MRKRGYSVMRKNKLKAVHDDDIVSLLSSLGCYEEVSQGQCKCLFCNTTITIENLGAIIPRNDEIVFSCNADSCLQKMIVMREEP